MHSCQHGVAKREEFGVDGGEHGLTAAVAVSKGEQQQVQQSFWEADRRQQAQVYNSTGNICEYNNNEDIIHL